MMMRLLAHRALRILSTTVPTKKQTRCSPQTGENRITDDCAGACAEERVAVLVLFFLDAGLARAVLVVSAVTLTVAVV